MAQPMTRLYLDYYYPDVLRYCRIVEYYSGLSVSKHFFPNSSSQGSVVADQYLHQYIDLPHGWNDLRSFHRDVKGLVIHAVQDIILDISRMNGIKKAKNATSGRKGFMGVA